MPSTPGFNPQQSVAGRRRTSGQRGQGTAELALMLPLLLILIVGIIESTAAFNAYTTVVSGSRDGARLGSKGAATTAQIQTLVVKDLGRLKNTTPASNITVSFPVVSGVNSIKVRACYNHTTFLKVPLIMPNSIQMCSETTMPKLS